MIDMVVHRHKMRETLARLCRVFMTAVDSTSDTRSAGYLNGRPYVNGHAIETMTEASGVVLAQAEEVAPEHRFPVRRGDPRGGPESGTTTGRPIGHRET
jgi:acetyl-CoA carboxylase carboxyl transferase subunit beta